MATAVKIAAPRPAPFFTPLFVAKDKGYFAEEGLDMEIVFGTDMRRLTGGEVDFMATGFAEVSFLEGADIRMVSGHSDMSGAHTLVIRSHIKSPAEAEELSVAGAEGERELSDLLKYYNVDLATSGIRVVEVPDSHPEQWRLLAKGESDGGMLGSPWWAVACKNGFKSYGSLADFVKGLPFSAILTTGDKVKNHPEQPRAFVRAYVKAMKYAKANKEGTLEAMMRFSSEWGVEDREVAEMVYDVNAPHWTPEIDLDGVRKLMEQACQKLGKQMVPVESYAVTAFIDEALGAAAK